MHALDAPNAGMRDALPGTTAWTFSNGWHCDIR